MTVGFAKDIAFRCYQDFAVLVQSSRQRIVKLNGTAGAVLGKIDQGREGFVPSELHFIEDLLALGVVKDTLAPDASVTSGSMPTHNVHASLLDEINRLAAARLIPLHAHVELTQRCPLACCHCYLEGLPRQPEAELTLPELEGLFDDLASLGTLFLTLSGGEPFLRDDLFEIVQAARQRHFAVSVLSSGQGASEDIMTRLAALGLDGVQVSLYGSDDATHEAFTRRAESYAASWRLLELCRDLGIPVRAAVTVTKANIADLPRLAAQLGVSGMAWSPVLNLFPRRLDGVFPADLQLDAAELGEALPHLPPRTRFRMSWHSAAAPPCNAARAILAIDVSGQVFPCSAWPVAAGSIRQSELAVIWREAPLFDTIRKLGCDDLQTCPSCALRATCNRCPGLAVQSGLAMTAHSPLDCLQAEVYSFRSA